jgi:hypothetical protein
LSFNLSITFLTDFFSFSSMAFPCKAQQTQ